MPEKNHLKKREELLEFIEKDNLQREDLIKVLHRAQESFGYIPDDVQVLVAEKLRVPLSEVNGVISFYSFFTTKATGKYKISVCLGTACYVKGAQKILEKFSTELGIALGETTEDGIFTLECCRCLVACGLAPVIMINNDVHGRFTEADVSPLIKEYVSKGQE